MSASPQAACQTQTIPEPPTILVVEDEVLIRLMIARHLRDRGFRVVEASHAGEALDALEADESIALLFTDVLMPGVMNGVMLARWVKQNRPDVSVLLTSACSDFARDFPDELLLAKPYAPEDVETHIRGLLGAH
ncbi:MAG: response regulator [Rhizomicrobium sp.]